MTWREHLTDALAKRGLVWGARNAERTTREALARGQHKWKPRVLIVAQVFPTHASGWRTMIGGCP